MHPAGTMLPSGLLSEIPRTPAFPRKSKLRGATPAWLTLSAIFLSLASMSAPGADVPSPAEELARAEARATTWGGPTSGPRAAPDKTIVYISADLRNGGVLGVAGGLREAAKVLGWKVKVIDLRGGGPPACAKAAQDAVALKADGVVLSADDAHASADALKPVSDAKIPILGWHTGPAPGPIAGTPVQWNVSTDPLEVARVAAQFVAATRRGARAGVIIFTDTRFAIAKAKSDAMAEVVRAAPGCEVLEVCDVPIDAPGKIMPDLTRKLLVRYGPRWTHALAINDLYFDHATPVFAVAGISSEGGISCISAGDGSPSAYVRIQAGLYQTATVAEPLNLQGWQLADEFNRLFSGAPLSGYVAPVHIVNVANIAFDGGRQRRFDPDNEYREAYKKIWGR